MVLTASYASAKAVPPVIDVGHVCWIVSLASSGVCVGESLLTRTIEQTRTLKDRPLILPAKGVADAEDFISDGMVQTELTGAIESVGKRPQSTFRSLC